MRLGLYYDLRNPGGARAWARVYAAALDRIGWADDAGIGAIWVTEHHGFADGYLPAPLTFCAAIAARTRRARIGTAVVVSPLIPPHALAEQAAVVDILSDGRLELGLGAVREHGRRNRASYEDAGAGGTAGREAAFPKLRVLTPAAAAAWISELCAGLPVTDVFCFGDIGGLDDDLVERHTELAVRELAPVLAGEGEL